MGEEFFKKLKEKVKPFLERVEGHEFEHSERVFNMVMHIGKIEKADLDVLGAAALLHDIARGKEDRKEINDHALEGVKMAKEILYELGFHKDKIEAVCYAIQSHPSHLKINTKTKEAAILQDADRLDSLGAIVISRIFTFDGKNNIPVYDPSIPPDKEYVPYKSRSGINFFYEKIFKLKPETFNTKTAKEIAKHIYNFCKEFVDEFLKEWNGEK